MKPTSVLRTLRLLRGYLMRPHGVNPNVIESRFFRTNERYATIVYSPPHRVGKTVVLIHGVSGRASDDPSLVHLARNLCVLGYRVVTPALAQLAQFRHSLSDVDAAAQGIAYAAELAQSKIGVFSFSYGASFALCAAAHPIARKCCSGVVGFGAYYQLADALEHQRKLLIQCPDLSQDDADLAYLRYTLLASHRDEISLSEDAWAEIEPILINYTTRTPIEVKRAPLLKHTRHIDYVDLMQRYQARTLPDTLSPRAVVSNILCPVGLLHDPADRFVPANQSELIATKLNERPSVARTLVLTTPMLSHVQVDPRRNLRDFPKLVNLLDIVLG